MPSICFSIASASSAVSLAPSPIGKRAPLGVRPPLITIKRLLPRLEILLFICSLTPKPRLTMAITAPTPIIMPKSVKKVRSLLVSIPSSAILMDSLNICRHLHSSLTSLPSRITKIRLVCWAISGSCVTITMVLPSSFIALKISIIS